MSQIDGQAAFLRQVCMLLEHANELGFVVTMGEAFRTTEQQAIYVKTGRSKAMNSEHLSRRAIDLNIFKDGKLCGREDIKPLGDFWEGLHPLNRWGGNWRGLVDAGKSDFIDAPHFERRAG
ncbi:MAG TPA: M15 family metallopeptidase [Sideroxyarcus sp.]|nr:M15 family metallopeptidase [Sideroxyarcus sp.]